jgi:CSLREA domain-containing protein
VPRLGYSPTTSQASPLATSAANSLTVNSTGDGPDTDTTDNLCQTATPGECTLRAAIQQANASAGTDTIGFNIPGAGPHTIAPTTALPVISDPVVIDGFTQPGSSPNSAAPGAPTNAVMKIELSGVNAPASSGNTIGLRIRGGSTVRGLVINRFADGAMQASGVGNRIEGNYIGLNVGGSGAFGSSYPMGIMLNLNMSVNTTDTVIGGLAPAARNVIAGSAVGIHIFNSTNTMVVGNYIGTSAAGTERFGLAAFEGIRLIVANNNTIGGTTPAARNVVSGHSTWGISLGGNNNVVQGNYIGTTADGTGELGNGITGVLVGGANNSIGGTAGGAGNVIAYSGVTCDEAQLANPNCGVGVVVQDGGSSSSAVGNAILGNSIHSSRRLGIDLTGPTSDPIGDNVTPNDNGDADTGPNQRQNYPVLNWAKPGSTVVQGSLNSTVSTAFRLEFFADSSCDPSGHGEGKTFLEARSVTTDTSGNVGFDFTLAPSISNGEFITATATDPAGNTSEFSPCVEVGGSTSTATPTLTPTTSVTPTQTLTPSPSLTRSVTPTTSPTNSLTSQPSPSITRTVKPNGSIGGRAFGLTALAAGGIQLDWQPGTRQNGYALYRFGDAGEAVTVLAGSATSYAETPPGSFVCYWLLAYEGEVLLATSDFLCAMLGSANAPAPPSVSVRLDQGTTTTIQWTPVGGADGYVMYVAQAPERSQIVGPTILSANDGTGGQFTCYAVLAAVGPQVGNSVATCVVPGYSFGHTEASSRSPAQEALRSTAQRLLGGRGGAPVPPTTTRIPVRSPQPQIR